MLLLLLLCNKQNARTPVRIYILVASVFASINMQYDYCCSYHYQELSTVHPHYPPFFLIRTDTFLRFILTFVVVSINYFMVSDFAVGDLNKCDLSVHRIQGDSCIWIMAKNNVYNPAVTQTPNVAQHLILTCRCCFWQRMVIAK